MYTVRIFMKMRARLRGSKSLFTLYQIINRSDFPYLADEIAEPHPDMNIKVAAFTVSEKSSNIINLTLRKPMDFPFWYCTIHLRLSIVYIEGSQAINFPK